jgi:hypothetical protein
VGGVYRDQGLEVLSKWLNTLFQSRVEAAYRNLRKLHLLPPETSDLPQPVAPTARYPSPDAGPALLGRLAGHLGATHPESIDRPNRRRRRSSSPREDGGANAGKQGDVHVHRGCHVDMIQFSTSSRGTPGSRYAGEIPSRRRGSPGGLNVDRAESARKRARSSGPGGYGFHSAPAPPT